MDLGLQFEELKCYSCVLDTVTRREETQEAIVSDSMPDIGSIITVTGTPYLHQSRVESGLVTSEGEISATVIYDPEGGGTACSIAVRIPFRCSVEAQTVSSDCRMNALPCLHRVDVKVLNPRKVLVQSELSVHFLVFSPQSQRCCVATEGQQGVQTKAEHVTMQYISQVTEKIFPVEDSVTLNTGHHGVGQLIGCNYVPYCNEAKLVGSKVVFKGGIKVCAKYLSETGELMRETCEVPVSQVLDGGNSGENSIAFVRLSLCDAECALSERGTMNIMLELYVCAMLVDRKEMELIVDAYSTRCPCDCGFQSLALSELRGHSTQLHPFRVPLDTELPSAAVLLEHATIGEVICDMDGQYRCRLKFSCALREGDGRIMKLDQNCYIDLPIPSSVERGTILNVQLLEAICISTAGGVEMRGSIYLSYLSISPKTVACISSLTLHEKEHTSERESPSAVLRRLQPGETLWDIGKAHSATVEEIMQINQVVDEHGAGGRFLLIPRSR